MEMHLMSSPNNLLEPWANLRDKVVLVTGASSGLGRDFCLSLALANCRIVAAARRVELLKSLCDEINQLPSSSSGVRAKAVELDVSVGGRAIEKGVKAAWEAFGRIDALINNAGFRGNVRTPLDLEEDEWNNVMRTNLTGSWLVSKYVSLKMRDAGKGGSIINISSISGLDRGLLPGGVAYTVSKAAVNQLTKALAIELGEHKIRVNSIAPGLFKSEITQKLMEKEGLVNYVNKAIPLKALGSTDPALTSLIKYLIHESSEYVSGNIFIADAGTTLPGVPIFSSL